MDFSTHISETDGACWPFADPASTLVYVETSVADGSREVQYVVHDEEGDWQFLDIGESDPGDPELVCFHCVIERHPELRRLADLPIGWSARRTDDGWHRFEDTPLED